MMNQQTCLDVMERLQHKYYGKYRGTVTEVDEKTVRIKAKVPAVLGAQATGWALPCVPYAGNQVGFAFLPEIGAGVWIEFEGGDVSMPVWTGCYWHEGEVPSEVKQDVKVLITASKHKVMLDDQTPQIVISDDAGNKITLDSNGVLIERGGQKVLVSPSKVDVNDGALEVT